MQEEIKKIVLIMDRGIFSARSAGLDTRFFAHRGTPAVTFGPRTQRIHSFDEWVSIESTIKTAETIAITLIDWCGV